MIQLLSVKYSKHIACILASVFLCSLVPVYGRGSTRYFSGAYYPVHKRYLPDKPLSNNHLLAEPSVAGPVAKAVTAKKGLPVKAALPVRKIATAQKPFKPDIGGPSQPEMSSFKSVGADNMVNLFTGDFSYNIPLLDVGGYPVNLFYDGGISMEQEASWVGLGWNINPGTVSRNMRGVPDDFNGDDILTQTQTMKPNKTWGVMLNGDLELVGIKDVLGFSVGVNLGVSFNNYLGPALDFGLKGGTNFTIAGKAGSEKTALKAGIGLGANINSRSGLTLSPNVSLTASNFSNIKGLSTGLSAATSYNSRTGIKQLQLSEQMSYNYTTAKRLWHDDKGNALWKDGIRGSMGATLASTTISFAKPSYTPSVRMPLNNEAYAGHFQLGGGIFGVYGSAEVEVYSQKSSVVNATQKKPLVGYIYYQKAVNNPNAVMDFTRLNENEVTPNTPIISAPQYTYDVFTIQGEGTGGSIRAYRNDMGYMRDNTTRSKDNSLSIGADIGIPGHFGANFNTIKTPTVISEWVSGNRLSKLPGFISEQSVGTVENVYFRNPGETSVLLENQWNRIGGTDLVRFKLGGTNAMPTIEPVLERFSKSNLFIDNTPSLFTTADPSDRKKRTQVTSFLTAVDAAVIGLDKDIKSYKTGVDLWDNNNILQSTSIPRVDVSSTGYRKKHHISQINVTQPDGKRYVYGIPVYSTIQKDFSFTVTQAGTDDDKVGFTADQATTLNSNKDRDGFLQVTETPGYAHSFLLSGLLSPDYVDVTGNGITEDDLGDAVKFNYTKMADHPWRTPHTKDGGPIANFNAGNRTEVKDDKGIISYGKRESWYLHSIESKLMIALFTLEDRADGKGPIDEYSGVSTGDNSMKRLQKIDLYNKADIKKNGVNGARPVKTVWFRYSYSLCNGTPDNASNGGKLTLDSIYFTYNGKDRIYKSKYAFAYTNGGAGNPDYAFNASDRWGTYKHKNQNPGQMKNSDYPYTIQDSATSAQNAAAWSLKKILLPSGGQIEVEYESDDYAFVQNRRAADMMKIVGLGSNATTITNKLYGLSMVSGNMGIFENDYVFINVPEPCANKTEVFKKYLSGVSQLAFKIAVNMPKGVEYIPCYGTIADYDKYDNSTIWVRLNKIDGLSPLTLSALSYLRERLPGQAFPGYDVSESSGLKQVGEMLLGMLDALKSAFKDPVMYLRSQGKAQTIIPASSFVRLNDPNGYKYGGGQRVKSVKLKDNWNKMSLQYTSTYGKVYDYTTTEVFNGVERKISSGVASYEPSIGGEENPFQSIVQITNKLPLGPASYGAVEMPVLDAFFPAPVVGYSKVTVRSLNRNTDTTKTRSGIGKQVTEFYTARDFPVYYNHTAFDPSSDKQQHDASLLAFFYKYAFDSRALSQGFIIETNDMHGKMKSQASYAENDEKNRVNYTENFYRNTGNKGLNDKFDFVYASQGGVVQQGNMGIDVELMTDTREFSVKSTSYEVQAQLDMFPVIIPVWIPFIWPVMGESENTYRAVTTTKVINYHGVLDSVVVIDKGSQVSTKNQVYDSETGDVVVTRTNNEFDKSVYMVKYPAWWAYGGMGLAYKNIDAVYTKTFYDGKMQDGTIEQSVIESGDELYILNNPGGTAGCVPASVGYGKRVWAFDKNKNNTSLTVPVKDLVYLDSSGNLFTQNSVQFRIVRSGKRNMLNATVAGVTMMADPVVNAGANTRKIIIDSNKVIDASAVEFREKWQIDNELIKKLRLDFNPNTCVKTEVEDCNGYFQKRFNPYVLGMLGNFRAYRNLLYYGDRTATAIPETNLPVDGFITNFGMYWNFDGNSNLVPDYSSNKWVWKSQVTRFNIKGAELETKDALGIYTAAQYGYHRTLPVAVTNNSPYDEAAYEGFEDSKYAEALNTISVNSCTKKHINLTGNANTQVVSSDSTGFAAHTGKYMLGVNSNSSASTSFNIKTAAVTDYPFAFGSQSTYALSNPGTNLDAFEKDDPNSWNMTYHSADPSGTWDIQDMSAASTQSPPNGWRAMVRRSHYFEMTQNGNISLYLRAAVGNSIFRASTGAYITSIDGTLSAMYWTPIPGIAGTGTFPNQSYEGSLNPTVFLCKGVYKVEFMYSVEDVSESLINPQFPDITFEYRLYNGSGVAYKNYDPDNGCVTTTPMPAGSNMLNPIFTPPASKKMLLSAWVREQCATCTTYTNNQIIIGGTVLKPSGPIIDGWQRYEGEFTPAAGGQITLSLVNNGSSTVYFDDIRIHPYNANMKSYVYDPVNLRLVAELDANNYAAFYEYDEEGGLIRTKAETKEGIKTIRETRSFQQRVVKDFQ